MSIPKSRPWSLWTRLLVVGLLPAGAGVSLGQEAAPAPAAAPATATVAAPAPSLPSGAEPVVAMVEAFTKAYNAQDAVALSAVFTDDAELVDAAGQTITGAKPIAEAFAGLVQESGVHIAATVEALKFLNPQVAQFRGTSTLSYGDDAPASKSKFRGLAISTDSGWKIVELRDEPIPAEPATSNFEHIKELGWMVGDWVDESDDAKITSKVRWAQNKNFLVRDYSIEIKGEAPMTGTMWLGWDPQTDQIKSWVFDSNGGHGEAFWTRSGENQWVLKAQGVTRDGRASSATQIVTLLNKDVVKHSSIDRIIGGEIAPDIEEVVMVRKPPQPAPMPVPAAAPAPAR